VPQALMQIEKWQVILLLRKIWHSLMEHLLLEQTLVLEQCQLPHQLQRPRLDKYQYDFT
jgi:hypothetical protein